MKSSIWQNGAANVNASGSGPGKADGTCRALRASPAMTIRTRTIAARDSAATLVAATWHGPEARLTASQYCGAVPVNTDRRQLCDLAEHATRSRQFRF
jgi:hypothetical protein